MLDAAWESGVRYFDVARSYGRAEEFLARWLGSRQIAGDAISVGSKWGYTYSANWQTQAEVHEVKEHSLANFKRQLMESRALLGDHLGLYQVHSATKESGILEKETVLDELARLKSDGLLVGLTLSGPEQAQILERALRVERDGLLLFNAVQATWNILEVSAGPALKQAHEAGLGVIVKEVLANGRLTVRNETSDFARTMTHLRETADGADASVDSLAIAFALTQPWIDVVLSGAAKTEHLLSNIKALDLTLRNSHIESLSALAEPCELYWQKRSKLDWN